MRVPAHDRSRFSGDASACWSSPSAAMPKPGALVMRRGLGRRVRASRRCRLRPRRSSTSSRALTHRAVEPGRRPPASLEPACEVAGRRAWNAGSRARDTVAGAARRARHPARRVASPSAFSALQRICCSSSAARIATSHATAPDSMLSPSTTSMTPRAGLSTGPRASRPALDRVHRRTARSSAPGTGRGRRGPDTREVADAQVSRPARRRWLSTVQARPGFARLDPAMRRCSHRHDPGGHRDVTPRVDRRPTAAAPSAPSESRSLRATRSTIAAQPVAWRASDGPRCQLSQARDRKTCSRRPIAGLGARVDSQADPRRHSDESRCSGLCHDRRVSPADALATATTRAKAQTRRAARPAARRARAGRDARAGPGAGAGRQGQGGGGRRGPARPQARRPHRPSTTPLEVAAPEPYVSRGGHKLAAALDAFGIDPAGPRLPRRRRFDRRLHRRAAAARRGARLRARRGPRPARRGAPARSARRVDGADQRPDADRPTTLPEPVDLASIDVSFISLDGPRRRSRRRSAPARRPIVALVKPQFEAGRGRTDHGVVRDPAIHREVLERVIARRRGRRSRRARRHRLADPRARGQPRVPAPPRARTRLRRHRPTGSPTVTGDA